MTRLRGIYICKRKLFNNIFTEEVKIKSYLLSSFIVYTNNIYNKKMCVMGRKRINEIDFNTQTHRNTKFIQRISLLAVFRIFDSFIIFIMRFRAA